MRKLVLVLVAVAVCWSSGAGAVPIGNGLVSAYEFNGNAVDASGNGNDGVVHGATLTADRFGNAGSAYSFDGVDDFIVSSETFSEQLQGTIAFWVRDTSANGQGGSFISSRSTSGYEVGDFFIGNDEAGDNFHMAYWGSNQWDGFGGLDLGNDAWIHLAFSWDSSDVSRLYLGGSLIDPTLVTAGSGTATAASYPIFSGLPLVFGNQQVFHFGSWVTDFATGDLDDIYIYDRALSPSEVQTLYSAVPEPSTALLLGLGLVGIAARRRV